MRSTPSSSSNLSAVDPEDFQAFVVSRGAHLFRTACLLTGGDTHLAEDLVQEAPSRVYPRWGRRWKIDNPSAHAQTVLVNVFITQRRKRSSSELPTGELADTTATTATRPTAPATPLRTLPPQAIADIGTVAVNPVGTVLATGGDDGTVRLWNPATQKQIGAIDVGSVVDDVAFNSAGTVLATADADGTVRLWNPATQRQIGATITISSEVINTVAFNSAGTELASADDDGTVRLWNPVTQKQTAVIDAGAAPFALALTPGDTMLAAVDEYGIQLWNPATLAPIGTIVPTEAKAQTGSQGSTGS